VSLDKANRLRHPTKAFYFDIWVCSSQPTYLQSDLFHLKESIDLLDSISILTPGNQDPKTRMVAIEKESAVFHRILARVPPRPQVEKECISVHSDGSKNFGWLQWCCRVVSGARSSGRDMKPLATSAKVCICTHSLLHQRSNGRNLHVVLIKPK